ncbi:TolB-like translocation protein [Dyella agri]|uniref:WD40-like Beta Propeller Repeat n=1 Tax=Dyella agri TaxID=1926869 RepID=A0ABW8KHH5_9GAMM
MMQTILPRCLFSAGLLLAIGTAHATDTATATPQAVTLDGIIHADSDDTLAFTPDGTTVFFDRSEGTRKTIMVSHKIGGRWSQPEVASFSGHGFDQDPVMAPDGSYLLFDSDRPTAPGSKPLVQDYFVGGSGPGSNIWRVDRQGSGWGKPVWLSPVVNNDVFIDFASIAADGSLYFIRWDRQAKVMHTWRAPWRDGRYLPPVRAGLGDPAVSTHDPAVAPDQSFIVFDYGKTKGGLGRLCIAFREGDHWGKPIDLGDTVNKDGPWGSHIASDGHSVYFTGQSGIWRLDLAPWLRQHAAGAAAASM